jgi:hypothetical protein
MKKKFYSSIERREYKFDAVFQIVKANQMIWEIQSHEETK